MPDRFAARVIVDVAKDSATRNHERWLVDQVVGVALKILLLGQRRGEFARRVAEEKITADVGSFPINLLFNAGLECGFAAGIVGCDEALDFAVRFLREFGCRHGEVEWCEELQDWVVMKWLEGGTEGEIR